MGTPYIHDPDTADTAAVITIPAVSGVAHELTFVGGSYNDTPTGGILTVESPASTVLHKWFITAGGAAPIDLGGATLEGAIGQDLVVRLTGGGGSVKGVANCIKR